MQEELIQRLARPSAASKNVFNVKSAKVVSLFEQKVRRVVFVVLAASICVVLAEFLIQGSHVQGDSLFFAHCPQAISDTAVDVELTRTEVSSRRHVSSCAIGHCVYGCFVQRQDRHCSGNVDGETNSVAALALRR